MNFLKNFFNDESKIIGLCAFEKNGSNFSSNDIINNVLFKDANFKTTFKTNIEKNIFLSV